MGTLHEHLCTLMVICGLILRMRNVSDKSFGENQSIHFINLFSKITPFMR